MNESQDFSYNPCDVENQYELFPLVSGSNYYPGKSVSQSYELFKENQEMQNRVDLSLTFLNRYLDFTFPFASREYSMQFILYQIHVNLKRSINLGFQGFYTEGLSSLRSVFEWLLKICDLEQDYRYNKITGNKGKSLEQKENDWKIKFEDYFLKGNKEFAVKNKIECTINKFDLNSDIKIRLIKELNSFRSELSKSSHMTSLRESSFLKNQGQEFEDYFPIVKKVSLFSFCIEFSKLIGYISLLMILTKPDLLDEKEAKNIQDTYPDIIPPIEGFWVGFMRSHLAIIPEDYRKLVKSLYKKK